MLLEQAPEFRRAVSKQRYGYRPRTAADRYHVVSKTLHHSMDISMRQLFEAIDLRRHAAVVDRVQRFAIAIVHGTVAQ